MRNKLGLEPGTVTRVEREEPRSPHISLDAVRRVIDCWPLPTIEAVPLTPTDVLRWPEDGFSITDAIKWISRETVLGYDVETTGLDPHVDRLRLIQIALGDGRVIVLNCETFDNAWALIVQALYTNPAVTLVGHNIGFDLRFTAKASGQWPDCSVYDTMIAAQLLGASAHSDPRGTYTLKTQAAKHLGVNIDKSLQVSFTQTATLSTEQIEYAARDPLVTLALAGKLQEAIVAADLEVACLIEMLAVPAIAKMEYDGMPFDASMWADLADAAVLKQVELMRALNTMQAPYGVTDMFGEAAILWTSPDQVLRALRQRPGLEHLHSTDENELSQYTATDPIIPLLLDFREAAKAASTYGVEWIQKNVHRRTKRIHPSMQQMGAKTGRMSQRDPNLQNIPRAKKYRTCFRPTSPNRQFAICDYSQIELRIIAQITKDPTLLRAYANGDDVHSITAAQTLDVPLAEVTKEHRQIAKSQNFGLCYGAGVDTFITYARTNYGVTFDREQATQLRDKYFDTYARVRRWHRSISEGFTATRTLSGRRRLKVEHFTDKLNTPVQGTGADMIKLALGRLYRERHNFPDALLVNVVHDEIVVECFKEEADDVAKWLQATMEACGQIFLPDVPVIAEPLIADSWIKE